MEAITVGVFSGFYPFANAVTENCECRNRKLLLYPEDKSAKISRIHERTRI